MQVEHVESGLNELLFNIDNDNPTVFQIMQYLNALYEQCLKQGIEAHYPSQYFNQNDIQLFNDFIAWLPKDVQFPYTLPPTHLKLLLDSCLVPRVCQFTNFPIITFAQYIAWVRWRYQVWMDENPDSLKHTRKTKQGNAEYMRGYRQRKKQMLLEGDSEEAELERKISAAYQEFKQACADRDLVIQEWAKIIKEKQDAHAALIKMRKK